MKKITFILFALIAGTGFAQDKNASADVFAEIVTPLTISQTNNLAFGTLVPNATAERSVHIAATAGATRSSTNPEVLVAGGGNGNPASFEVTSSSNNSYSYNIDLTSENGGKLTTTGGDEMAIIYDFSGDADSNLGNQVIYVGGTLTLSGGQSEGSYSDKVTVTVSYN